MLVFDMMYTGLLLTQSGSSGAGVHLLLSDKFHHYDEGQPGLTASEAPKSDNTVSAPKRRFIVVY